MRADKDGRDVSSAMGGLSQVGNVLTSCLCVCVCVCVELWRLRRWVEVWYVCVAWVVNIWASFWSSQVDSVATAAPLPPCLSERRRQLDKQKVPLDLQHPYPSALPPPACLFFISLLSYVTTTTHPQSCYLWADGAAPQVDKCHHVSPRSPSHRKWLATRSWNKLLLLWLASHVNEVGVWGGILP